MQNLNLALGFPEAFWGPAGRCTFWVSMNRFGSSSLSGVSSEDAIIPFHSAFMTALLAGDGIVKSMHVLLPYLLDKLGWRPKLAAHLAFDFDFEAYEL